jgi:hypothetical protein
MGILQGHRGSVVQDTAQVITAAEDIVMRRESAATFTPRRVPIDPYTAWLEQRKADREREQRTELRWVHRVDTPIVRRREGATREPMARGVR